MRKISMCRVCHAQCPVTVTIEDGRAVSLDGIKDHPVYHGYACAKGRALPSYHVMPERLLGSRKMNEDGVHIPISSEQAFTEVAAAIKQLHERHGPRAIAVYIGTHGYNNLLSNTLASAWMEALGSPMIFTSVTIDQPGKAVAAALHGTWLAGAAGMEQADVWMMIGSNPIISMLGPVNPAHAIKRNQARGMRLIAIDPRKTELARRADLYLQVKPGNDPTVLAGILHIIFARQLQDNDFLNQHVRGVDALKNAVAQYTPRYVEQRTDAPAELLIEAAQRFAAGRRGVVGVGTGPNMSGHGNLTEYLGKVLMTACGHWLQAGDELPNPGVLINPPPAIAQALDPVPAWGFGEQLRIRGLGDTSAGLPTAALADEILLAGEGQVKALINIGGNPLMAWPDQHKTIKAIEKLALLVSIEPVMSATARRSHYVMAVKTHLELAGATNLQEMLGAIPGWGYWTPYAQYVNAAVAPPAGSDLIEDWEFFYETGRRLGLQLNIKPQSWLYDPARQNERTTAVDMINKPTADSLYDQALVDSPVPLSEVRKYPGGHIFDRPKVIITAGEDAHVGKLDIGNAVMMAELQQIRREDYKAIDAGFKFTMVSRRAAELINSSWRDNPLASRRRPYNPAFMNPDDLASLGLCSGDTIKISSAHASINGVVEADKDVKPGVISMTHCWGDVPGMDDDPTIQGACTSRLSAVDSDYDPYTGIPRMSAIPVNVTRIRPYAGAPS